MLFRSSKKGLGPNPTPQYKLLGRVSHPPWASAPRVSSMPLGCFFLYLPGGTKGKERGETGVATGLNQLIYHVIGNRTLRHETQSGEKSISQPRLASISFETEVSKLIALSSTIQREEEKEKGATQTTSIAAPGEATRNES